ncbi:hypothetical protein [Variovorax sp. CF313]|uniref:hypothetical protein n=1 Tax=Variovorax sp. CF313 TaxID=1144315 RepID=UPI001ED8C151|nr:hypothetical protein [Variovorax sp. CF313]
MPNIASILKAEISRVARREVRAEIETLKKASVSHRSAIAELRRQVSAQEKELRRVAKGAVRPSSAPDSGGDAGEVTKRRFSASRLAAHRAKLGLSQSSRRWLWRREQPSVLQRVGRPVPRVASMKPRTTT